MEKIFGGIIEFQSKEILNAYVEHMDMSESLKIIEGGLEFAHGSGLFTMEETHLLFKCLLKLKSQTYEKNDLFTNNNNGDINH